MSHFHVSEFSVAPLWDRFSGPLDGCPYVCHAAIDALCSLALCQFGWVFLFHSEKVNWLTRRLNHLPLYMYKHKDSCVNGCRIGNPRMSNRNFPEQIRVFEIGVLTWICFFGHQICSYYARRFIIQLPCFCNQQHWHTVRLEGGGQAIVFWRPSGRRNGYAPLEHANEDEGMGRRADSCCSRRLNEWKSLLVLVCWLLISTGELPLVASLFDGLVSNDRKSRPSVSLSVVRCRSSTPRDEITWLLRASDRSDDSRVALIEHWFDIDPAVCVAFEIIQLRCATASDCGGVWTRRRRYSSRL